MMIVQTYKVLQLIQKAVVNNRVIKMNLSQLIQKNKKEGLLKCPKKQAKALLKNRIIQINNLKIINKLIFYNKI